MEILEHIVCLGAVSVLGVLEQAYFSLQVIYARRKYSVSPPSTSGPPEFERIFRAQANCSEYFPIFITALWMSGLFFSQGLSAFCGLLYLYGRYLYFCGYAASSQGRLAPLYFSAKVLWVLISFSSLGIVCSLCRLFLGLDLPQQAASILGLSKLVNLSGDVRFSNSGQYNILIQSKETFVDKNQTVHITSPELNQPITFHHPFMSILQKITDKLGMPSSSSFNPKPIPLRMDASLSSLYNLDYNTLEAHLGRHDRPTFSLGGHRFSFHEGQWVVERDDQRRSSRVTCRDCLERLRRRNQRLKEQYNLLKLQVDVLMDMVVDMQAAAHLHGLSLEGSGRPPSMPQQKKSSYEKVDNVLWD